MSDVHAADLISRDLIATYQAGVARLQAIVQAGLQRGLDPSRAGGADAVRGDASLQYRQRQLDQANAVLRELHAAAGTLGPATIARSYTAGLVAVDRSLRRTGDLAPSTSPAFGTVHQRAVQTAASNLTDSLRQAVEHAGTNVAAVFERANRLEGGLPVDPLPGGFVGRRVDDPYRRATLESIGQGLVAGDTRRDISQALAQKLVREGTTDALTGFVDKAGRRWDLGTYATMATRTTTREVMSRAVGSRLQENGQDLVTISSHPHQADECTPYDGNTFSLSGDTAGYDVLDDYPPFHPNCLHVVTPASDTLDAFEAELLGAVTKPEPIEPPAPTPPRPPAKPPVVPTPPPTIPVSRLTADDKIAKYTEIHGTPPSAEQIAKLRAKDATAAAQPSAQAITAAGRAVRQRAEELEGPAIRALATRRAALEAEVDAVQAEIDAVIRRASQQVAGHPDYDNAFDKLKPLRERRQRAESGLRAFNGSTIPELRQRALLDALAEARPGVGTGRITNIEGNAGVSRLLNEAARFLPKEWVDTSNASGTITAKASRARAFHQRQPGGSSLISTGSDPAVALHELAHRLQSVIDRIPGLEREFYNARITNPDGSLIKPIKLRDTPTGGMYGATEVSRGAWTHPYIGRDYGVTSGRMQFTDLRELLSMGLEGLFYDRHGLRRLPGDTRDPVDPRAITARDNMRRQIAESARRAPAREERLAVLERSIELQRAGDTEFVDFILGLLTTI